jgi:hypothetical protein
MCDRRHEGDKLAACARVCKVLPDADRWRRRSRTMQCSIRDIYFCRIRCHSVGNQNNAAPLGNFMAIDIGNLNHNQLMN